MDYIFRFWSILQWGKQANPRWQLTSSTPIHAWHRTICRAGDTQPLWQPVVTQPNPLLKPSTIHGLVGILTPTRYKTMWPNTFNKKCATISGWQGLGDFTAVREQLQKLRSSTTHRPPTSGHKNSAGGGIFGCGDGGGCRERHSELASSGRGRNRPLPPLPTPVATPGGSKSVRFNIPGGIRLGTCSGSETSDQGYESDQSKVSPIR
jgi:hypothetical protein